MCEVLPAAGVYLRVCRCSVSGSLGVSDTAALCPRFTLEPWGRASASAVSQAVLRAGRRWGDGGGGGSNGGGQQQRGDGMQWETLTHRYPGLPRTAYYSMLLYVLSYQEGWDGGVFSLSSLSSSSSHLIRNSCSVKAVWAHFKAVPIIDSCGVLLRVCIDKTFRRTLWTSAAYWLWQIFTVVDLNTYLQVYSMCIFFFRVRITEVSSVVVSQRITPP